LGSLKGGKVIYKSNNPRDFKEDYVQINDGYMIHTVLVENIEKGV